MFFGCQQACNLTLRFSEVSVCQLSVVQDTEQRQLLLKPLQLMLL
jgi:hypothetical protein